MDPDGKVFYDEVHTDEVDDQMTTMTDKASKARVDKGARAREDMEARGKVYKSTKKVAVGQEGI